MDTDKEMTEILRHDFSALNEDNREKVVEMTKFLVLTQNTIVPGFLEGKSHVDMFKGTEKEEQEIS
jgi:hypothetical protein